MIVESSIKSITVQLKWINIDQLSLANCTLSLTFLKLQDKHATCFKYDCGNTNGKYY